MLWKNYSHPNHSANSKTFGEKTALKRHPAEKTEKLYMIDMCIYTRAYIIARLHTRINAMCAHALMH